MQYVFTAVFTKDVDGMMLVSFPDLPGCTTQGKDMISAAQNAESVLRLCLFDMEQHGVKIPKTRYPEELELREGEVTSMVVTNTDPYHTRFASKVTDHTLSLPAWVGQIADSSNLDLSRILLEAVKEEIGMPVHKSGKAGGIKPIRPPGDINAPSNLKERTATQVARTPNAQRSRPSTGQRPEVAVSTGPLNNKRASLFTYVVIGMVALTVLMGAFAWLATQTDVFYYLLFHDPYLEEQEDEHMQALMQAIMDAMTNPDNPYSQIPEYGTGYGYGPEPTEPVGPSFAQYRDEFNNPNIIGRISIDGTGIDSIVVQADDNYFYRTHNLFMDYDQIGAVFMDEHIRLDNENNHLVLHGSAAHPGTLFSELPNFVEFDQFARNPLIRFTTDSGAYLFELFSFHIHEDDEFPFGQANLYGWELWVEFFRDISMHQSITVPNLTDQVLTLVAPRTDGGIGNYVLHARRLLVDN